MDKHPNIGNNIRKLREQSNYTQQYIAHKLELNVAEYDIIENTEDINTIYLFKIAAILGTSVQKILNLAERVSFEVHNNKEAHAYGRVEHLHQHNASAEEQQLLISLMKRLIEKMD
jgi:transcriptional regulator with XRE-family HTH domain